MTIKIHYLMYLAFSLFISASLKSFKILFIINFVKGFLNLDASLRRYLGDGFGWKWTRKSLIKNSLKFV